jgi:hypothetical protein
MRLVACSITARTWAWVPPGRPAVNKPRQDRLGLAAREPRPGRSGPARRAAGSRLRQNVPRRRRRYLHSPAGQLAVDPAVPPSGVLPGQPQDQGPDGAAGRRPAARAAQGSGGPARPAMPRCPRPIVSGVTSSRSRWRRAVGITPGRAASRARSPQFTFGRRGCRRRATASWWRRIKISAVCHACSRRDSRSHEATRVIRRKTNRRHMIGDHHGRDGWESNSAGQSRGRDSRHAQIFTGGMPVLVRAASKESVNCPARSRTRNLKSAARSPRSIRRLRIC